MIGKDCVVEIEALDEKQIRAGILDLVFHPLPKKLLVIIPANVHKKYEDIRNSCQHLLEKLIQSLCPKAKGLVVVLSGTGHDEMLKEDCERVREALSQLRIEY